MPHAAVVAACAESGSQGEAGRARGAGNEGVMRRLALRFEMLLLRGDVGNAAGGEGEAGGGDEGEAMGGGAPCTEVEISLSTALLHS